MISDAVCLRKVSICLLIDGSAQLTRTLDMADRGLRHPESCAQFYTFLVS